MGKKFWVSFLSSTFQSNSIGCSQGFSVALFLLNEFTILKHLFAGTFYIKCLSLRLINIQLIQLFLHTLFCVFFLLIETMSKKVSPAGDSVVRRLSAITYRYADS